MDTVLLVCLAAGAAYAFLGRDKLEQMVAAAHQRLPAVEMRHVIGAGLLLAAAFVWAGRWQPTAPTPAPPPPDSPVTLVGKFSPGPDAAADAARIEALFDEVAAELEWDTLQADQLLKNGVAFDELRVRAFDLRLRGESLGAKHPRVREAIKTYLDAAAGVAGGPLTMAQKSAWVAAFRTVARAAGDAIRSPTEPAR